MVSSDAEAADGKQARCFLDNVVGNRSLAPKGIIDPSTTFFLALFPEHEQFSIFQPTQH